MPVCSNVRVERLVITGASGFIGTHLCRAVEGLRPGAAVGVDLVEPTEPSVCRPVEADIRQAETLRSLAERMGRPNVLIHFAASAEVVLPWAQVPTLLSTNIAGTRTVLDELQPDLVVFASSGSVYGNARMEQTVPDRQSTLPLSLYAMSKFAGEMIIRDWTRNCKSAGVVLRLGNVIGPGCRGLIPYIARHLRQYPEGDVPVRLRGDGCLVRDYVPVDYVVDAVMAAVEHEPPPGTVLTANVGTGRGMTNREVAGILADVARQQGYRLTATFGDPPGAGEALEVVLDPDACVHALGLTVPDRAAVRESLSAALLSWLT